MGKNRKQPFVHKVCNRGAEAERSVSHSILSSNVTLCNSLYYTLEKEMATHSSVLVWRIPGMGEPGGLSSLGLHRVGQDWNDLAAAAVLHSPWNSPGQNTGVGSRSLLQGIFPTQGSNPGLPHCRQIFLPAEPPITGKPHSNVIGNIKCRAERGKRDNGWPQEADCEEPCTSSQEVWTWCSA